MQLSNIINYVFIIISLVSIAFSFINLKRLQKYSKFIKTTEGNDNYILNTRIILYFLTGWIIINIIIYFYEIFFQKYNFFKFALLISIPLIVININYLIFFHYTIIKKKRFEKKTYFELLKENFNYNTIVIGIWLFGIYAILFYFGNTELTNQKTLFYINLLTIGFMTFFIYKLFIGFIFPEKKLIFLDYDLFFLNLCLYLYICIFYFSNIILPKFTTNFVNHSPIFFLFINLIVFAITDARLKQSTINQKNIDETKNIVFIDYNYKDIKKFINKDSTIVTLSRKTLNEIEDALKISDFKIKHYWLSEAKKDDTVNPNDLEKLLYIITKDTGDYNNNYILFIENLEYLISFNGVKKTLDFLQNILDYAKENRIKLICYLNTSLVKEDDLRTIIRDFDFINPEIEKDKNQDINKKN